MLGYEHFDVAFRSPLEKEIEAYGAPTDVVYSAGINRLDWIRKVKMDDFMEVYKTNVWGLLNVIRVLDGTAEAGPINLVGITSDAAWRPMRTSAVYCGSKAAMEMTLRVASREYAPKGWRINGVAPGKVDDTEMTRYVDRRVQFLRGWTPEYAEAYENASSALGRRVTLLEVAEVVDAVLMGPAAQTGEIIAVNGGR
jgi:sorbitol-6-phosphate 2-dehydrogenase